MILEKLSREREETVDEIKESRRELKKVAVQLTATQDKCETLKSTFQELEVSYNKLTSEIGAMRRKLVKKKVQSKNAQEKLSKEKAGHLQMQKKILKIEGKIATNKTQLSKSSKKQAQLQATLDKAASAKKSAQKVVHADLDVEKLELELDRLRAQKQRLESSVKTFQFQKKEVDRLQEKIDCDTQLATAVQQECKDLQQNSAQLKIDVAKVDKQLCAQNISLKKCKDAMQSTASKIQKLDTQIDAALRNSSQNRWVCWFRRDPNDACTRYCRG